MKTHMIHCNSEFRAYALIRYYALIRHSSAWWVRKHETQSSVNHVCFHLVTQFYTPLYTNVYWALFSSVNHNFTWLLLLLLLLITFGQLTFFLPDTVLISRINKKRFHSSHRLVKYSYHVEFSHMWTSMLWLDCYSWKDFNMVLDTSLIDDFCTIGLINS